MGNNYGSQKKHIAKTGTFAGLWVNCNAKENCRNGGTHISSSTLAAVQTYLADEGIKKPLPKITEDEVLAFHKASLMPHKNSFEALVRDSLEALVRDSSNQPKVATPIVPAVRRSTPPKIVTWEAKEPFVLDPTVFHQLVLDARMAGIYCYSSSMKRRKSGLGGFTGKEVVVLETLTLKGPEDKVKKVFDRMQWGISSMPAPTVYRIGFE